MPARGEASEPLAQRREIAGPLPWREGARRSPQSPGSWRVTWMGGRCVACWDTAGLVLCFCGTAGAGLFKLFWVAALFSPSLTGGAGALPERREREAQGVCHTIRIGYVRP